MITIGFDDLPAPDWTNPLPSNYMGLQWGNFYFYDLAHAENPGYTIGIVSPSNAVFNGDGYVATLSSGGRFDLTSAYLTAAFEGGVLFEARGFAGQINCTMRATDCRTQVPDSLSLISWAWTPLNSEATASTKLMNS